MPGFSAFQATAFQGSAFQSGFGVISGDYSLGSPEFATPPLQHNYQLSVPAAYSLGSPVFGSPTITAALITISVNPYSLGASTYGAPFLRATQKLTGPSYSLSLSWGAATLFQSHRFDAPPAAFILGSPTFGTPTIKVISALSAPSYSLGTLAWSDVPIGDITFTLLANDWSLQSPRFGYPRFTAEERPQLYPRTYLSQVEDAAEMLRTMLNILLSGIPPQPITDERNTVRRLISILRANAEQAVRGDTLGTSLFDIFNAADAARANYAGVENTRRFLMTQVASKSLESQRIFRSALLMTLGLECKIVSRMQFKTQTQIRNMILHLRDAFDQAKRIGLDEVDVLTYQVLTTMAGEIINHLAVTELQLPRFVTYETAFPMPSLYLAQRIYQDPKRADELENENSVIHPAFMPRKLRVLSDAGIPLNEQFLRPRPPAR